MRLSPAQKRPVPGWADPIGHRRVIRDDKRLRPREIVVEEGGSRVRVNRRFLYAGVFLAAIGGVLVATDLDVVDTAALADAVRLWPLIPIAIGLGILLRRTQFSLSSGLIAAAIPGLVLGAAFAAGPRFVGDCGARRDPAGVATQQGTFEGP